MVAYDETACTAVRTIPLAWACAMEESAMKIEHTITPVGQSGKTLVQVYIRDKQNLKGWACAVDSDWRIARAIADEKIAIIALGMREKRRHELGLPDDCTLDGYIHQRFRRQLAMDGGAWAEEAAIGNGQRIRRMLGTSFFPLHAHSDALTSLAVQYSD